MSSPASAATQRLDAILWAVLSAVVLLSLRDAYVSADGLGNAMAAGLRFNPNHLLFEPLNAAWLRVSASAFGAVPGADRLRWLSAIHGALALGIFRFALAPRLTASRAFAQLSTAAVALCAGFLQMWLSAEPHILQMPAVVASAAALLRWREAPALRRAVLLGLALAFAILCFASLAGLALTATLLMLADRHASASTRRGSALLVLLAVTLVAGGALCAAWRTAPRAQSFAAWSGSYAGGAPERTRLVYGVQPGVEGVTVAAVRAGYGAVSTLVDLHGAFGDWRDRGRRWPALILFTLALLGLAVLARAVARRGAQERPEDLAARTLLWFLAPPVLLFGWIWNNSDAQFYLPLAVAIGAGAARLERMGRPARTVLGVLLLWNAVDAARRYAFFPRAGLSAPLLRETQDACAVVTPGFDDATTLLVLQGREVVPLAALAVRGPADMELPALRRTLENCLAQGRRVELVNLFGRPPQEAPWKFLAALGYTPETVQRALGSLPLAEDRLVGPFALRAARPAAPAGEQR